MDDLDGPIDWIRSRLPDMAATLEQFARVNSYSGNLAGLDELAGLLLQDFGLLNPRLTEAPLAPAESIGAAGQFELQPLGKLLRFVKRPEGPRRVLLVIHYDTVYPPGGPPVAVARDGDILRGPGVADAKGGIVVMLYALLALERLAETGDEAANRIGWEVILNPDEEIGSPGSGPALAEAAGRNHLGLVFEPPPGPGMMVTRRKGSGNFSAVFRGRGAHAGRDVHAGRNAVLAAARFALAATESIFAVAPGVTINVSKIDGGGPANVVPDLAVARFNVRVNSAAERADAENRLAALINAARREDGIRVELHGGFSSPPWGMAGEAVGAFERLRALGAGMGLELTAASSGGASDANKLAAAGLPVLDSLGPVGGDIHSPAEWVDVASLAERAALVLRLLHDFGRGR